MALFSVGAFAGTVWCLCSCNQTIRLKACLNRALAQLCWAMLLKMPDGDGFNGYK